jgi:hypothetical protein
MHKVPSVGRNRYYNRVLLQLWVNSISKSLFTIFYFTFKPLAYTWLYAILEFSVLLILLKLALLNPFHAKLFIRNAFIRFTFSSFESKLQ